MDVEEHEEEVSGEAEGDANILTFMKYKKVEITNLLRKHRAKKAEELKAAGN